MAELKTKGNIYKHLNNIPEVVDIQQNKDPFQGNIETKIQGSTK